MLLVTDLDNTLYDWVTFFAHSFQAMLCALSTQLDVPEERLTTEFKSIHQRYGNSEQPFAILELPSLRQRYPGYSKTELLAAVEGPLKAFEAARKQHLKLYDGVAETLDVLTGEGIKIVGHT